MNTRRLKDFTAGAILTAVIVGGVTVGYAKVAQTSIPVTYNNIKVIVDGKQLVTEKEPFIYNGTTYLPVRAVGEAVGKTVGWDGKTNTVTLSSTGNTGAVTLPGNIYDDDRYDDDYDDIYDDDRYDDDYDDIYDDDDDDDYDDIYDDDDDDDDDDRYDD